MHFPSSRILKLPPRRVRAIDCGAGHVAGAEFARGPHGRLCLLKFGIENLDPDPAGCARWAESAGRALVAIAGREGIRGSCRLSLPGHSVLTKFVRTPAAEPARRPRIAEFEAQQGIPASICECSV